jgi:signal transduction histidine kinase/ligand-binding sensor domain-containing protein
MSQYLRNRWGPENGFPGGSIHGIAQTSDGYLWIGAEKGLVRFDGARFVLIPHSSPSFPTAIVLGLATDREGELWLRLRGPRTLRYHGGEFENVMSAQHLPDYIVTAMGPGRDGSLLLAGQGSPLYAYRGGRLQAIAPSGAMPPSLVMALAETSDGQIWIGTRDAGLFRMRRTRLATITRGLPDLKVNCLLPGAGDELWVGTDNGIVRWDGNEITRSAVPASLAGVPVFAMIRDRDGNIWVGTARGLYRLDERGVVALGRTSPGDEEVVTAIFEDREGTLWTGGPRGLERIREGAFATYAAEEGLPSPSSGPVYSDSTRTWFAPAEGGLYWLKQGQVGRVSVAGLDQDVGYSIAGGGGEVWIGRRRGGLTRLREEGGALVAQTFTRSDGLAQDSVYAVLRTREGEVWAGTLSGGASRLRDGRFVSFTTADGLASNTVTSMLEDASGRLWFATPGGLSGLSKDRWTTYRKGDGLPSDDASCLYEDKAGVLWIGTAGGLAVLAADHVQVPANLPPALREPILGIAGDDTGSLWISTASSVWQVDAEKLRSGGAQDDEALREYGLADGLQGQEGVKRHQSVAKAPDGRIWFSMNRGLSVVSPRRVASQASPALVQIQAVTADDASLDLSAPIRIPAGRQRVAFRFAGLSLATNERVRYRYKLVGFDRGWSAPTAARDAVYTNLGPGPYQFVVMASNGEGRWNGREATVGFLIAPALWQTTWFRLSALLACAAGAWALIRLRTRQLARQLSGRFEERLAERTRIAQELHDTLLQGLVSASMQLHVASEQVPADLPAKASIGRVLKLMETVVGEGRNAVRGLRSSASPLDDLEEAFSRVPQELGIPQESSFRVIVEGAPRPLQPVLRDEVYRIGREALVNAFRHARAENVELQLEYGPGELRMLVRDDGCGMDQEVLESGREGHWGLPGMRERALRVGASLRLWSRADAGTEVELSVPGELAFPSLPPGRPWRWLTAWLRRKPRVPRSW